MVGVDSREFAWLLFTVGLSVIGLVVLLRVLVYGVLPFVGGGDLLVPGLGLVLLFFNVVGLVAVLGIMISALVVIVLFIRDNVKKH